MEIASIIISGLAIAVAVGNFIYTQARMDSRESVKWRRDTLTKATSDFVAASEERNRIIAMKRDEWSTELGYRTMELLGEMKQCRNQFWIVGAHSIYLQAGVIMDMHTRSASKGKLHSNDATPVKAIVDIDGLNMANTDLIIKTRRYINSKKIRQMKEVIPQDNGRK